MSSLTLGPEPGPRAIGSGTRSLTLGPELGKNQAQLGLIFVENLHEPDIFKDESTRRFVLHAPVTMYQKILKTIFDFESLLMSLTSFKFKSMYFLYKIEARKFKCVAFHTASDSPSRTQYSRLVPSRKWHFQLGKVLMFL